MADDSTLVPINFRYGEFWDVPRIFVVEHEGQLWLFDCPFSDELDDYPDEYAVYLLDPGTDLEGSWRDPLGFRATGGAYLHQRRHVRAHPSLEHQRGHIRPSTRVVRTAGVPVVGRRVVRRALLITDPRSRRSPAPQPSQLRALGASPRTCRHRGSDL